MKQTTLFIALLTLGCGVYNTAIATTTDTSATNNAISTSATPTPNQVTTTTQSAPKTRTAPQTQNTTTTTTTQVQNPVMDQISSMDCNYVIQGDIHQVSPEIISEWASQAVVQSFSYDYKNITKQFDDLKECFTPDGWKSFYSAMQESKNMQTTEQQQLTVSAQVEGKGKIIDSKTTTEIPSWEVEVPLKVTYKNATKNLSQNLTAKVTLVVINGTQPKLGITQIVASSTQAPESTPAQSTTTTTSTSAPAQKSTQTQR